MHEITILEWVPHYGDVNVAIASDAAHRSLVGIETDDSTGDFVFIEVDWVTLLELRRGGVGLYTVMAERCVGSVSEQRIDVRERPSPHVQHRVTKAV